MITPVLVLARTLHIGSALLMVSLLFFQQVIIGADKASDLEAEASAVFSRQMARGLMGAFLVQIMSGAVWFWIVAAEMSGNSLRDVLDFNLLKIVSEQTQFGRLWLLKMFMTVPLGIILFVIWRSERFAHGKKSAWLWMALALSVLLLISLAWAGHAASGTSYRALHEGADILHLAVASIWPVGLVPLTIFLNTISQRNPSSRLGFAITILNRFSKTSLTAVVLIFLTGFANACFLIPSFSALFVSSYGQLLLGKVALFVGMVGLGALNRCYFLPNLQVDPAINIFLGLRRTVLIESMLGLIVLLIVGVLGVTAPPQPPN